MGVVVAERRAGRVSGLVRRGTSSVLSLSPSRLPPPCAHLRLRRCRRWPGGVLPLSRPAPVISCAPGVVRDLFPGGGRDALALLSRRLPPLPPRLSPALMVPGWLCRVRGRVPVPRGGLARPAPPSGPRVSAPLLSGYLALAFRRGGLKTPGGSPYRPRGRGDGGARRDVGRPREAFPVPPRARRSLRLSGAPSGRRRFPGRRSRGRFASPLWAPEGSRPERPACPARWRAAAGCRVRGVPRPVVCPAFPFPTLCFFFPYVSRFVSRWPARGGAPSPSAPLFPSRRGGRGRLLRSSAPV